MKTKTSNKSYNFILMREPLKFDVKCGQKIVIPAGTEGVRIAFGQSHLVYLDEATNKWKNMNVYLHKGRLYHA